jgi:hypothetical protein
MDDRPQYGINIFALILSIAHPYSITAGFGIHLSHNNSLCFVLCSGFMLNNE